MLRNSGGYLEEEVHRMKAFGAGQGDPILARFFSAGRFIFRGGYGKIICKGNKYAGGSSHAE